MTLDNSCKHALEQLLVDSVIGKLYLFELEKF